MNESNDATAAAPVEVAELELEPAESETIDEALQQAIDEAHEAIASHRPTVDRIEQHGTTVELRPHEAERMKRLGLT